MEFDNAVKQCRRHAAVLLFFRSFCGYVIKVMTSCWNCSIASAAEAIFFPCHSGRLHGAYEFPRLEMIAQDMTGGNKSGTQDLRCIQPSVAFNVHGGLINHCLVSSFICALPPIVVIRHSDDDDHRPFRVDRINAKNVFDRRKHSTAAADCCACVSRR